jgi:hypothetical protein
LVHGGVVREEQRDPPASASRTEGRHWSRTGDEQASNEAPSALQEAIGGTQHTEVLAVPHGWRWTCRAIAGGGGRVSGRSCRSTARQRRPTRLRWRLISFFTTGEDECRAWTIVQGTNAQDAAGTIHSDLARGFIRAEVIRWDQLLEAGSEAAAKKRGWVRQEGKAYSVADGDVLHVLFNV